MNVKGSNVELHMSLSSIFMRVLFDKEHEKILCYSCCNAVVDQTLTADPTDRAELVQRRLLDNEQAPGQPDTALGLHCTPLTDELRFLMSFCALLFVLVFSAAG